MTGDLVPSSGSCCKSDVRGGRGRMVPQAPVPLQRYATAHHIACCSAKLMSHDANAWCTQHRLQGLVLTGHGSTAMYDAYAYARRPAVCLSPVASFAHLAPCVLFAASGYHVRLIAAR